MNAETTNPTVSPSATREGLVRSGRCPCCGVNLDAMSRGRRAATASVIAAADAAYADLAPRVVALRAENLSMSEIADVLNGEGLTTRRGKPWTKTQIFRVLRRPASYAGPSGSAQPGGTRPE